MKSSFLVLAVVLCAGLALPSAQAMAQEQHQHEATSEHAAAPIPATRYQPDAPLRAGMRTVHQAVAELVHAEKGHMGSAMIRDRAATIESAVMEMFANCKLEPTPDAALHGILVPLLGAAQTLKANPADTAPVARMRDIMAAYPRYFDDPGWDALPTAGGL
jgi:hypothetical protein